MQGQLSEHPLAELIREVSVAGHSGALRLERERVKVVAYFEKGALVFAASNLRAHRLREFLLRNKLESSSGFSGLHREATDEELSKSLIERGICTSDALAKILGHQVSDILRVALLWTDGTWEFDSRARLAGDRKVQLDINRLLLECARHLPGDFVASRFVSSNGKFSRAGRETDKDTLLPAEAFVLSQVTTPITLADLTARFGSGKKESLRTIYALSLSGLLQRSDWPSALDSSDGAKRAPVKRPISPKLEKPSRPARPVAREEDLQGLFARLERASNYYEVLDLGRLASAEEIKDAYHGLAMRYHPDRFHQSEPELRRRVDSAFARIAQAYETLNDPTQRSTYDARWHSKTAGAGPARSGSQPKGTNEPAKTSSQPEANRAELSFQNGMAALQQDRRDEGLRLLAEAATLAPREARYRAHYGHALAGQANSRRTAETELKAAIALEPGNTTYRVMLAELYEAVGLRRRAQGELERALAADPGNEAALSLLSRLKGK